MLGPKLDYLLLRPLAHRRNCRTEAELDARSAERTGFTSEEGRAQLEKLQARLGASLPLGGGRSYLDVGCGTGALTLALHAAGCRDVTGVDLLPRQIVEAKRRAAELGVSGVDFICGSIHEWQPQRRFDVVFSHEALEHIEEPRRFLERCHELASPSGILVLAFGPLFHSPFGDHMQEFFRLPLPWRGAIFSEQAILRLRRQCYRPSHQARDYRDVGLNLMKYSEFLEYVDSTGWRFRFLDVNPQLRRLPGAHAASTALLRIPGIRDYLAMSVYAILERSPQP